MSASKILKIKDADGNLQRVSSTDETYLAWQAGKQMAASSGNSVGDLTMTGTPNRTIGSHTNTFYQQPVGTHPASQLTIGSTTSTLKQRTGSPSLVGAQYQPNGRDKYQKPITYTTLNDKLGIHPMLDDEFDDLVDRLNSIIATNDYVGSYKLAATAPSSDYTERFTLGTDTRTDGTSVDYKIWQRTTQTAPTSEVQPAFILDSDGYQGLAGMNNTEARWTLGQAAKGRRQISGNIGNYQLRSSVEGAPTDTGSWKNVGTALDTRNTTSDQIYTRSRVSTYTRERDINYEGVYVSEGFQIYTGDFTGNYGNYSRPFTGDFLGYTHPFTGDFTTDYQRGYQLERDQSYASNFESHKDIDYVPTYAGDYIGTYNLEFIGDFVGQYSEDYEKSVQETFTDFSQLTFTGNFQNFTSPFTRDYQGNFQNFASPYEGNYSNFANPYNKNYTTDYTATYQEDNHEYFIGNFVKHYDSIAVENYQSSVYTTDYSVPYEGAAYNKGFSANVDGQYIRNYESTAIETYVAFATNNFISNFSGNFATVYNRTTQGDRTLHYTAGGAGDFTTTFQKNSTAYYQNYLNPYAVNYQTNYLTVYTSNYAKAEYTFDHGEGYVNEDADGFVDLSDPGGVNAYLGNFLVGNNNISTNYGESYVSYIAPFENTFSNIPSYYMRDYQKGQPDSGYVKAYSGLSQFDPNASNAAQHNVHSYQGGYYYESHGGYEFTHHQSPGGGGSSYTIIWGGSTIDTGSGNPSSVTVGSYTYYKSPSAFQSVSYLQKYGIRRLNPGGVDYNRHYITESYTKQYTKENDYTSNFIPGVLSQGNNIFTATYTTLLSYLRYFTDVEYIANYIRTESINYSKDYVGQYITSFLKTFEGNFQRQYEAIYTGDFTSFTSNDYQSNYQSSSQVQYIPNYQGNYIGDFVKHYQPTYIRAYQANYSGEYAKGYELTYSGNFTGDFAKSYSNFTLPYVRTFIGNFNTPYEKHYQNQYTRKFTRQRTQGFTRTSVVHRTSIYTDQFTTNYSGNYTGTFIGTFTGTVSQPYSSTSTRQFGKHFEGNYSGFVTPFTTTYQGDFERHYTSTYISNYLTDFERNYESEFIGNYTRGRVSTFTRNITIDRTAAFEGNYTGDFIRTYDAVYENYNAPFVGEYSGLTIDNTQETVETYTLYVRQS